MFTYNIIVMQKIRCFKTPMVSSTITVIVELTRVCMEHPAVFLQHIMFTNYTIICIRTACLLLKELTLLQNACMYDS